MLLSFAKEFLLKADLETSFAAVLQKTQRHSHDQKRWDMYAFAEPHSIHLHPLACPTGEKEDILLSDKWNGNRYAIVLARRLRVGIV